MPEKEYLSLAEYLSYKFTKKRLLLVDRIINEWKGKFIQLCRDNDDHLTIMYKIIDVDKENSRLIVKPVIMEFVKEEHNKGWGKYKYTRTYKLRLKDKTASLKFAIHKECLDWFKIGRLVGLSEWGNIKTINIRKPFVVNTDYKYKGVKHDTNSNG